MPSPYLTDRILPVNGLLWHPHHGSMERSGNSGQYRMPSGSAWTAVEPVATHRTCPDGFLPEQGNLLLLPGKNRLRLGLWSPWNPVSSSSDGALPRSCFSIRYWLWQPGFLNLSNDTLIWYSHLHPSTGWSQMEVHCKYIFPKSRFSPEPPRSHRLRAPYSCWNAPLPHRSQKW